MLLEELKILAGQVIDKNSSELFKLSMSIWNNPELAFEEKHAHEVLTEYLEKKGFQVSRNTPLDTAFVARYASPNGTDGPRIGLMCEYDALPGIGHACGHNLIAEIGVAAAIGQ